MAAWISGHQKSQVWITFFGWSLANHHEWGEASDEEVWTMAGAADPNVSSVNELVGVVEAWEGKFFDPGIGFPPIWYRGQSDAAWQLIPGEQLIGYVCGRDGTSNHAQPFVLPILPDLWAGRMFQQGSCFTFHMPTALPLESIAKKSVLEKYVIPMAQKQAIRTTLRRMM